MDKNISLSASELIKKLEEGYILAKRFRTDKNKELYLFLYTFKSGEKTLEVKGWVSGINKANLLEDIVLHPEYWYVHDAKQDDFPWSETGEYRKRMKLIEDRSRKINQI